MTFFTLALAWILKYKKILIYIGIGLLALVLIFGIKSCFTKEVKIDLESIQKINTQNEKERKAELEKIINENQDVVKTVDERNTIVEENIEQRNKEISKKIDEVDKKIQEVKSQGGTVNSEELECLLVPENCK